MTSVKKNAQGSRIIAAAMVAGLTAACSSDVSRFGDSPFTNPFQGRAAYDPGPTGSIKRNAAQPKPLNAIVPSSVTSQALPAPKAGLLPAATGAVASSNYPALGQIAARNPSVLGSSTGWSAVGGTPVTLGAGENVNSLSSRYGVPASAIMAVNGLSNANAASPGQKLIIPAYSAMNTGSVASSAKAQVASAAIERAQPLAAPVAKVAAPAAAASTLAMNQKAPVRQIVPKAESEAEKRAAAKLKELKGKDLKAKAPASDDDEDEKPAAKVVAPKKAESKKTSDAALADARKAIDAKKAAEAKKIAEAKKVAEAKKAVDAKKAADAKLAKAKPAPDDVETTASISESKSIAPRAFAKQPEKAEAKADDSAGEGNASFRWPAQGRVISGFGTRGTGGANDGINIAVPEGTPIRAAEGGVVVHADDALKGYGKLVLVRHPNGYVSVYAHNSEIKVKRGESVKRGQVIAASGSSGNVTSPQLHFEIRKGATPVDPNKLLSSN